jgi:tetratricopeptide (TPR) repeat protein
MKNLLKASITFCVLAAISVTQISFAQTRVEAITAFNEALEVAKGNDFQKAIAAFQKAADIATKAGDSKDIKDKAEKQLPTLQFKLAGSLYSSGKVQESIDAFKKAAEYGTRYGDADIKRRSENNLPTIYYAVGNNHLKANKFAEADAAFNEALKLNPNFANAYYGKYLSLKAQNKWDEAVVMANKTVEMAKKANDNRVVNTVSDNVRKEYIVRGVRRSEAKSYTEAIGMFNDALKFGEDPDAHYRMAETYNKMGQSDNAIASANKSLELEKGGAADKAKIYFELGTAQMAKGNFTAACSSYKLAAVGSFKNAAEHHMKNDLKCGN